MQTDETSIEDALKALQPSLLAHRRKGWVMVGVTVIIASFLQTFAWDSTDEIMVNLLPTLVGFIALFFIHNNVARKQQNLVLPKLAGSVGLDYQQDAKSFLAGLPPRLLPNGRVRTAEDRISGAVGNRHMTLAEVKIETGGKRSRILFRGFVVRFKNLVPLPAFFLATEKQTKGWFGLSGRIIVSGLTQVDKVYGHSGESYGIWLSDAGMDQENPALHAVLGILTTLEQEVGPKAQLFSATSNGEVMHIALTHPRDLFSLGGLFAGQDQLMIDVQNAFKDLNIPLKVVTKLLDAEAEAEKTTAGR